MNFMLKQLKSKENNDNGFSLIELIVVVIVLGIIAAIVIPVYNGMENRARASAVETTVATTLKEAIAADLMGADDVRFTEILENNSSDDITVTYHDNNGDRSNVPGDEIIVEGYWTNRNNGNLTENFNFVKSNFLALNSSLQGWPIGPGPHLGIVVTEFNENISVNETNVDIKFDYKAHHTVNTWGESGYSRRGFHIAFMVECYNTKTGVITQNTSAGTQTSGNLHWTTGESMHYERSVNQVVNCPPASIVNGVYYYMREWWTNPNPSQIWVQQVPFYER